MALTKTHESILRKLRKETETEDLSENPEETLEAMDELYSFSSTRVAITALMKAYPECAEFAAFAVDRFAAIRAHDKEKAQKATPKQEENHVPWEKILELRDGGSVKNSKDKVLLALYTYLPPVRCDYTPMKILKRKPRKLEDGMNYLLLGRECRFLFHAFKTHKTIGDQIINIPAKLKRALLEWIQPDQVYLFEDETHNPVSEHALGVYVARMFEKYTGKTGGINMLRHSYATYLYKDTPSLEKMEKESAKMLQQNVIRHLSYAFKAE